MEQPKTIVAVSAREDVFTVVDSTTGETVETGTAEQYVEQSKEYESIFDNVDTVSVEPTSVTIKTEIADSDSLYDSFTVQNFASISNLQGCRSDGFGNETYMHEDSVIPFSVPKEFQPQIIDSNGELDFKEQKVTSQSGKTEGWDKLQSSAGTFAVDDSVEFDIGMLPLHIAKQQKEEQEIGSTMYLVDQENIEEEESSMYILQHETDESRDSDGIEDNLGATIEMVVDDLHTTDHPDSIDKNSTYSNEDTMTSGTFSTIKVEPLVEDMLDQSGGSEMSELQQSNKKGKSLFSVEINNSSIEKKQPRKEKMLSMKEKLLSKHNEDLYCCPKPSCKVIYVRKDDLQGHLKYFHEGYKYHCEVDGCYESFYNKEDSQRHYKQIHFDEDQRERSYGLNIERADGLLLGLEGRFSCQQCYKSFKCMHHLKEHTDYHNQPPQYGKVLPKQIKERESAKSQVVKQSHKCVICKTRQGRYGSLCNFCKENVMLYGAAFQRLKNCVKCGAEVKKVTKDGNLCDNCKAMSAIPVEGAESVIDGVTKSKQDEILLKENKGIRPIQEKLLLMENKARTPSQDKMLFTENKVESIPYQAFYRDKQITVEPMRKQIKMCKKMADFCGKTCLECLQEIGTNHFRNLPPCTVCKYRTECIKSYLDHLLNGHQTRSQQTDQSLHPIFLKDRLICACGLFVQGDTMIATHLTTCYYLKDGLSKRFNSVQGQKCDGKDENKVVPDSLKNTNTASTSSDRTLIHSESSDGNKFVAVMDSNHSYSYVKEPAKVNHDHHYGNKNDRFKDGSNSYLASSYLQFLSGQVKPGSYQKHDTEAVQAPMDTIIQDAKQERMRTSADVNKQDRMQTSVGMNKQYCMQTSTNPNKQGGKHTSDTNKQGSKQTSMDVNKKGGKHSANVNKQDGKDSIDVNKQGGKHSTDVNKQDGKHSTDVNKQGGKKITGVNKHVGIQTFKDFNKQNDMQTSSGHDNRAKNLLNETTKPVTYYERRVILPLLNPTTQNSNRKQTVLMKVEVVGNELPSSYSQNDNVTSIDQSQGPVVTSFNDQNKNQMELKTADSSRTTSTVRVYKKDLTSGSIKEEKKASPSKLTSDNVLIVKVLDSSDNFSESTEIGADLYNMLSSHNYCLPLWRHLRIIKETPKASVYNLKVKDNVLTTPTCFYSTNKSLNLFYLEKDDLWRRVINFAGLGTLSNDATNHAVNILLDQLKEFVNNNKHKRSVD